MKIKISTEKLKGIFMGRGALVLFFLMGIFFSMVMPIRKFLEARERREKLEGHREEELKSLEIAQEKTAALRKRLNEERETQMEEGKAFEGDEGEGYRNISYMKDMVAVTLKKRGLKVESIGRASLNGMDVNIPYAMKGRREELKGFFLELRSQRRRITLGENSLELTFVQDGDEVHARFRLSGRVETGSGAEEDERESEGDGDVVQLKNSRFPGRVRYRENILINGREYEVTAYESGSREVEAVGGKKLEKKP